MYKNKIIQLISHERPMEYPKWAYELETVYQDSRDLQKLKDILNTTNPTTR